MQCSNEVFQGIIWHPVAEKAPQSKKKHQIAT